MKNCISKLQKDYLPAKYVTHAVKITATTVNTIVAIFHEHLLVQVFLKWNLDDAIAAEAEKAEVALNVLLLPVVGGAVGGWINWGLTQFAMGTIGPVVEDGVLQNTGMGLL